ncbi:MAG: polysaccharide deacetylase family protein [Flavobacteriales bacterium]|nr:polysaccharide deacetylase family protein [Flavobacteriales bacterium]
MPNDPRQSEVVKIYSQQITPRLAFACELIFTRGFHVDYEIHEEVSAVRSHEGIVINYSKDPSVTGFQITPSGFINQRGISEFEPEMTTWDDLPALFPTQGEIPFDVFSAVFFLASRYEEYLPYKGDQHGRFQAEESFAHKNGFLDRPLIDEWVLKLKDTLNTRFQSSLELAPYSFTTTIDVDSAYAYRYKGLMRTLGGFAKDVVATDSQNLKDRFNTIFLRKHDPFDTYDELHEIHQKYNVDVIYFFLLADYGLNDKGVSYKSRHLQQLVRRLGDYYTIGIHPGYQSNRETHRFETELGRLATISRRDIEHSRQHFLMLKFPETYRRLLSNRIKEDHTMGYASLPGFRASTSRSFPFYDLEHESITALELHPFAVMDATLNMYQERTPEDASKVITTLAQKVKAVSGQFRILWHNESLSEKWGWEGWKGVYERAIAVGAN